MRKMVMAAVAIAAVLCSAGAMANAPDRVWRVLSVFPSVMTMVAEKVEGPKTKRVVATLVALDKRDDQGVDYEIAWYDVNCVERTIRNHSNMLYGARKKPTGSLTKGKYEPYADDAYFSAIGDYACYGVRESEDNSRLVGDAEAFAYGRKLAAEAASEGSE